MYTLQYSKEIHGLVQSGASAHLVRCSQHQLSWGGRQIVYSWDHLTSSKFKHRWQVRVGSRRSEYFPSGNVALMLSYETCCHLLMAVESSWGQGRVPLWLSQIQLGWHATTRVETPLAFQISCLCYTDYTAKYSCSGFFSYVWYILYAAVHSDFLDGF